MKKLSLVLLLLIVTVILGVLLQNKHSSYQTKLEQDTAAEVSARADEERQRVLLRENFVKRQTDEIQRLRVECQKGVTAYELLTKFTKAKADRPECEKILVP